MRVEEKQATKPTLIRRRRREREKEVKSRCSLDKLFLSCLILTFVYLLITGAEAIVAFDHTHNR